jgi:hypothetical protein
MANHQWEKQIANKIVLNNKLKQFFGVPLDDLHITTRTFRSASWPDLQPAIEGYFAVQSHVELLGLTSDRSAGNGLSMTSLLGAPSLWSPEIAPIQYDEVPDIGERRLRNGLWLAMDKVPLAVLLYGTTVEIAMAKNDQGLRYSAEFFRDLENRIKAASTFRGKAISLEVSRYGEEGCVKVHKLRAVSREEVILPEKTLLLLERNVNAFMRVRQEIKSLGFSGKKGLLFYGPPGTGKTHTIHYLASQLPGHSTLLISAGDIGRVRAYFDLARFLEPSMIVIEDVDIIASARGRAMGEEMALNDLLNEMDGLQQDADVLVVLTTNNPGKLEPALASRPGRIDQVIEFPLPDDQGRAKLIKLYARGLTLSEQLRDGIVKRTKGASAAFIKELMRRCAQYHFEMCGNGVLQQAALDGALEEMLFQGGMLNLKLLGGSCLGFKMHDVS